MICCHNCQEELPRSLKYCIFQAQPGCYSVNVVKAICEIYGTAIDAGSWPALFTRLDSEYLPLEAAGAAPSAPPADSQNGAPSADLSQAEAAPIPAEAAEAAQDAQDAPLLLVVPAAVADAVVAVSAQPRKRWRRRDFPSASTLRASMSNFDRTQLEELAVAQATEIDRLRSDNARKRSIISNQNRSQRSFVIKRFTSKSMSSMRASRTSSSAALMDSTTPSSSLALPQHRKTNNSALVPLGDGVFRGEKKRYVTRMGGFTMALRRTIGTIGAAKLGLVLQEDIGRDLVTNWELRLRAALVAAAVRAHQEHQSKLKLDPDRGRYDWRFMLHSMRGDATNAAIWQKRKLRVHELQSYYASEHIGPGDTSLTAMEKLEFVYQLASIQAPWHA